MYADDTRLYVFLSYYTWGLRASFRSAEKMHTMMLIHELKLNDDKTEYIIFQFKHHDQKYGMTVFDLFDFTFESGTSVRNLGAYFDKHMSMKKTCDRGLPLLIITSSKIFRSLTRDAYAGAVRSAILSRIDCSSALLGGFYIYDFICIRDFTIFLRSTSPMNQEDLYDLEMLEQCSPLLKQTMT